MSGVIHCFAPLLWTTLVLLIIMYVFAILFIVMVTNFLMQKDPGEAVEHVHQLEEQYGSMPKVLSLLFEGVTGGDDWAHLCGPLLEIDEKYYLVFCAYIIFMSLGVLNIVTASFMEETMQRSIATRDDILREKKQKKLRTISLMQDAFRIMDIDQSGTLSRYELESSFQSPHVQELFSSLELTEEDVICIFELIDVRMAGMVTIDEFVWTVVQSTRSVTSLDIFEVNVQCKYLIEILIEFWNLLPGVAHREEARTKIHVVTKPSDARFSL